MSEFDKLFRTEFKDLVSLIIFQNDDGEYEAFDRYRLVPANGHTEVYCYTSDVGTFSTTKSALSWCIADKHKMLNLAREIKELDAKLTYLRNDIDCRARIGDKGKDPQFKETMLTKLETKLIRKKQVEQQLEKCINLAKYKQQKEFNNETVRTGRTQAVKANR